MAEEFIPILENDIGALGQGRTAAKVRGVDDQGQSINLTPTQIASMSGIDYSKTDDPAPILTWDKFLNLSRKAKSVYTRTIQGTMPTGSSAASGGGRYVMVPFPSTGVLSIEAFVDNSAIMVPPFKNSDGMLWEYYLNTSSIVIWVSDTLSTRVIGRTFTMVIKHTKE